MATETLLQLKSRFFRYLGAFHSGTATGEASTAKLTDSALAGRERDCFKDWQVRITSGITDLRWIAAGPNGAGDIEPRRAFSGAVSTNTYEVWGPTIDGGAPLTRLFNDVLAVCRPVDDAEVTIVDNQAVYDLSSFVSVPGDVIELYVRSLNPANELPYRRSRPAQSHPFAQTVEGVPKVYIELASPLVSDGTRELWLRHRRTFEAFVDDTSTVQAEYAAWLAWEAVLLHATQEMASGRADRTAWQEKARQASANVTQYRRRFMPFATRPPGHGHIQYD